MRNAAALDQYDGVGDDLVGETGDVHELELDDLDAWEDETTVGDPPAPAKPDPTPSASPAPKAAKKSTRKGSRK